MRNLRKRRSLWTRQELEALIKEWKNALMSAASGSSYKIDGRELTRQDIDDIKKMLAYLEDELDKLDGQGGLTIVIARPRR